MPYVEITMAGEDTPPFAHLAAERDPEANVSSAFILDASLSTDADDDPSELQCRWDLDGDGAWETAWGDAFVVQHDFEAAGTHAPVVEVMDTGGATDTCSALVLITDVEPPDTAVSLAGSDGDGGWFVSEVSVSLSASDSSTVASTWCNLDGGGWEEYSGPLLVPDDGLHAVGFYSVDWEHNVEDECSCGFGIDCGAPEVAFVTTTGAYTVDDVTLAWTCSDAVSGMNRSELSLDGARYIPFGSATSHTLLNLVEGIHTVFLRVYDNAGNFASDSYTFTVDLGGDDGEPEEPRVGGDPTLLYLGVVVAVVAAFVVVAVVVARRKR
jgi:hypothetical protein